MKNISVDVAIIGAGSAGISAMHHVMKSTENFVIIDAGPLGTTCARKGCMPSKVLIHAARDFHARHRLASEGISGADQLECDIGAVFRYVRAMRDKFTGGMIERTKGLAKDRLIEGKARIIDVGKIEVGETTIEAKSIIVATGSTPVMPAKWKQYSDKMLTTDNFFEQESLPDRVGVIGLGAIGLEIGQALSRLGLDVTAFDMAAKIGGLSDPDVNSAAVNAVRKEFPIHLGGAAEIERQGDGLRISTPEDEADVDVVLVAAGIAPALEGLGLEEIGVDLDDRGLPKFNPCTMQIGDFPIYLAGDATGYRAILHEAIDEGLMAGGNAIQDVPQSFCRRTPLRIVFSEPEIAVAGCGWDQLGDRDFVVGAADFSEQSRAMVERVNNGLMHIYAESSTGKLLGAEIAAPGAEHLGHTLALAIEQEMSLMQLLRMPFYHPTLEEGLRTAVRDAIGKLPSEMRDMGLSICRSCPESVLC